VIIVKRFNSRGVCVPEKHYMVDVSAKLVKIMELIDQELYFTINRPRQDDNFISAGKEVAGDYRVFAAFNKF
jgi:hypothetical protein